MTKAINATVFTILWILLDTFELGKTSQFLATAYMTFGSNMSEAQFFKMMFLLADNISNKSYGYNCILFYESFKISRSIFYFIIHVYILYTERDRIIDEMRREFETQLAMYNITISKRKERVVTKKVRVFRTKDTKLLDYTK
jgi:hypothetical protein